MSEEFEKILIYHCAPTIRGIKSANLINCSIKSIPSIMDDIKEVNSKGNKIHIRILKSEKDKLLILVYNLLELSRILLNKDNQNYLCSFGYKYNNTTDIEYNLRLLSERINSSTLFPNEIGVFLGYDLDDIKEFDKGNKNCLYVGYWKVYSNLKEKLRIFSSYNYCKKSLIKYVNEGNSIVSLV